MLSAFWFDSEQWTYLMVIRIKIAAVRNATKSPSIDLTSEGSVAAVPKEDGNDSFFKGFRVVDSPGSPMWQPRNFPKFGTRYNHVKFHGKGRLLVVRVSLGDSQCTLGRLDVRKVTVSDLSAVLVVRIFALCARRWCRLRMTLAAAVVLYGLVRSDLCLPLLRSLD